MLLLNSPTRMWGIELSLNEVMNELSRQTIHRVIDGDMRNLRLMAYIYHNTPKPLMLMSWLINERYTGYKLYDLQVEMKSTDIPWRMVAFITKELYKRGLHAGKDIV